MDAPRATWMGGIAVFVLGLLFGAYWWMTREGLGALGGPVMMLMGAGVALVVMVAAVVWSVLRGAPLSRPMLLGTGALALLSAAIAGSIVWSGRATRDGVDLPLALLVVAVVAIVVTAWAWTKARPAA